MNRQKTCAFIANRLMGWTFHGVPAPEKKCILLGAPHTSIWDFVISYLFYTAIGGQINILVKKSLFVGPLKGILLRCGAIPVNRGKGAQFLRHTLTAIKNAEHCHLGISPEGTRRATKEWKSGFHLIARTLNLPVYCCYFDWSKKEVGMGDPIPLTSNPEADMLRIKQWYIDKKVVGKYPNQFDPYP